MSFNIIYNGYRIGLTIQWSEGDPSFLFVRPYEQTCSLRDWCANHRYFFATIEEAMRYVDSIKA